MEFAVSRQLLADELSKLQSIIPKSLKVPILGCIKIESDAETNGMRLTATNTESTITVNLSDKLLAVTEPGSMCIPAKQIVDIFRLAEDGPIKVSSDASNWISYLSQGSKFRRPGMDPANYPEVPSCSEMEWFEIPLNKFKTMLPGVKWAVPSGDERLNLKGVKVEVDSAGLRLVTTDGHRLSLAAVQLDPSPSFKFELLISIEAVNEVTKLMTDQDGGLLSISEDDNSIFFKIGQRVLAATKMIAKFPGYSLPFSALHTYPYSISFAAEEWVRPIRRALLCSNAGEKATKKNAVALHFEGKSLRIHAEDNDEGEANEIVTSNFNGPAMEMHFNGRYLLDFLEPVGSGKVIIEIKDSATQAYLTASDADGGIEYYYCLMPMR